MIIIGEKINGAIPSIKQAIAEKNDALIVERTLAQANAGAHFLDCAPSTATEIEYETMVWLIGLMQGCIPIIPFDCLSMCAGHTKAPNFFASA